MQMLTYNKPLFSSHPAPVVQFLPSLSSLPLPHLACWVGRQAYPLAFVTTPIFFLLKGCSIHFSLVLVWYLASGSVIFFSWVSLVMIKHGCGFLRSCGCCACSPFFDLPVNFSGFGFQAKGSKYSLKFN